MKVLDLCSGLNGWTAAFRERGHEILAVDSDPNMPANLFVDVRDLQVAELPWRPDLVLASPPCETFSVASISTHWDEGQPVTREAKQGIEILRAVLRIVDEVGAPYVIENPRGMMRKLPEMRSRPRWTIWQCRYGNTAAKPTDLWSEGLPSLVLRPECRNGHPDHESAPRTRRQLVTLGSTGIRDVVYSPGTQGKSVGLRAEIPYELSLEVCEAAEIDVPDSPTHANALATGHHGRASR